MNRREVFLSAGLVFLIALVVRIAAASLVVFPQPEDTAYYVGVARNLLEGHGLTSDALWSYGTPPLSLPPTRLRGLAAPADLPGRDPDGAVRRRRSRRPS